MQPTIVPEDILQTGSCEITIIRKRLNMARLLFPTYWACLLPPY